MDRCAGCGASFNAVVWGNLGNPLSVTARTRHNLARALSDAAIGELHRQIEYKAARRGSTVLRVGQFEPTSKACGGCGHRAGSVPLSVRQWRCPACGAEHNRDVNAARVILKLGRATAEVTRGEIGDQARAQPKPVPVDELRICAATRRRSDRRRVA